MYVITHNGNSPLKGGKIFGNLVRDRNQDIQFMPLGSMKLIPVKVAFPGYTFNWKTGLFEELVPVIQERRVIRIENMLPLYSTLPRVNRDLSCVYCGDYTFEDYRNFKEGLLLVRKCWDCSGFMKPLEK